jgi:hypothetical protein
MGKYDRAPTVAAGLLRMARDRARLTQGELARLAGVTQQAISAYETGRREPTLPTLMALLSAAGFDLRLRLEPLDRGDASLDDYLATIAPERLATLERSSRERAAAARLRRIKGD